MPDRWAFEAIGHDLGLRRLFTTGGSKLGPPLLAEDGNAGTHSTGFYWGVLVIFIVVFLIGARIAVDYRSRPATRSAVIPTPNESIYQFEDAESHWARRTEHPTEAPSRSRPRGAQSDSTSVVAGTVAASDPTGQSCAGAWNDDLPRRLGLGRRASAVTGSQTSPTFGPGRGSSTSCSSPTPTRVASSAGRHHDHCAPTSRSTQCALSIALLLGDASTGSHELRALQQARARSSSERVGKRTPRFTGT